VFVLVGMIAAVALQACPLSIWSIPGRRLLIWDRHLLLWDMRGTYPGLAWRPVPARSPRRASGAIGMTLSRIAKHPGE